MNNYIIIDANKLKLRIEELKRISKEFYYREGIDEYDFAKDELEEILSQSISLTPDIKDIQIWLSKQSYQKEYGEQEYMMYYDVDIPKIIQDYIKNLTFDI